MTTMSAPNRPTTKVTFVCTSRRATLPPNQAPTTISRPETTAPSAVRNRQRSDALPRPARSLPATLEPPLPLLAAARTIGVVAHDGRTGRVELSHLVCAELQSVGLEVLRELLGGAGAED